MKFIHLTHHTLKIYFDNKFFFSSLTSHDPLKSAFKGSRMETLVEPAPLAVRVRVPRRWSINPTRVQSPRVRSSRAENRERQDGRQRRETAGALSRESRPAPFQSQGERAYMVFLSRKGRRGALGNPSAGRLRVQGCHPGARGLDRSGDLIVFLL